MDRKHKNLMHNKFAGIIYPVALDCRKASLEVIDLAQKIFVDSNCLRILSI